MTPKKDEALKLALAFIEDTAKYLPNVYDAPGLAIHATLREALAEQPAPQLHCDDCGGFDPECPLEQPAQGCEFCSHPLYAGTKCKNCGREQPAIKQDLTPEQPEQQEPVAWMFQHEETGRTMCVDAQQVEWGFEKGNPRLKKIAPLYPSPPASKPWVPLTEFDIDQIPYSCSHADSRLIAFAIEAKLREKNT